MKYDVIYSNNLKGLVDAVNKYLGEGWKLQGGINTQMIFEQKELDLQPTPALYFYQAICKEITLERA